MAEYKTEQRKQVTEFIERYGESALSLDEWTKKLRAEGYTIGRSTVYRTLIKLEKDGIVISTKEQRHRHYQIAPCCDDHLHLKCTGCGKLFHLSHEHSHALKQAMPSGFSVDNIIYGMCKECK